MGVRPVVSLGDGAVRGIETAHGDAFLGVPYGQVRRFAPPRAVAFHGVRDADRPGPIAPQPRRPIGVFTHGEPPAADEQCLSLNVWRPRDADGLPVLVWIHGGGFGVGWGSALLYDGARLAARERLIVITINYRLGSLGFLHHPALGGGNWGLLDQRLALRWVAEHVAAFGGDPDRVTLAGQSAGALSGIDHLAVSADEAPFARAILTSPPLHDAAHDPALGTRWAEALSARAGGEGPFDVAALRRLPTSDLVALAEDLLTDPAWVGTRGGALPMLDRSSLPLGPDDAARARLDVPVMVGTTAQEGAFFFRAAGRRPEPDADGLRAMVARLPHVADADAEIARAREEIAREGIARERASATGPGSGEPHDGAAGPIDTNSLLVRIAGEAMVVRPATAWARARAAAGGVVHRFRIDHPGPDPDLGAMHSVDVPLLFGTYGDGGPGTRLAGDTPAAAAASDAYMSACGAFARGEAPGWSTEDVAVFGAARETVSAN
ncbi:MAG TPA: carboxylesterase family protein [Baekduia sp.]|uniref:carboxylesterase family protein n=1 Tax=Baekduia sp. TaxID=2600305 RepID=UPI002D7A1F98|nr:carboxylesterase family protein [Baekduia sp.]HET6506098.1 carboxylesterase family protein [Baekduia sp.]